jgi:predicted aminopeptidase
VYVVSASERTRLVPYLFSFPIVGEVAYQSFFDEDEARAAASELEAAGYDVYLGLATAYSTLGYLRDPVTTVMMRKGRIAFIEVLLHEMTHGRLYVPGDSEWSEQLASFVAERGLEQYVALHHAGAAALQDELRAHLARRRAAEVELRKALAEARALYASSASEDEKLRRRAPLFAGLARRLREIRPDATPDELTVNNARLLQYERYVSSAPELQDLWRKARGNWVRFWSAVEARVN